MANRQQYYAENKLHTRNNNDIPVVLDQGWVKPKTIKMVSAAFPQSTQLEEVRV
jgi:hypothetical protein